MEIPHEKLNADTLRRVIEEFVTREGTDYGEGNWDLSQKVSRVYSQLEKGEVFITFDQESETLNLVGKENRPS